MQASKGNWFQRLSQRAKRNVRWLAPGIGVKRWVLFLLLGTTLVGVALALILLEIYRSTPDNWMLPIVKTVSLQSLDRPLRVLVFGSLGVGLVLFSIWKINRSLLKPYVRPGRSVLDTVTSFRKRERGPRVVVLGGGTGLSSLLRGLKEYTNNITAIVTVADDGGSSGELRRNIGILPPGDIRNCLAALSDDEELITQLFKYRFGEKAGLSGHSLGNLLITALTDITGSFEEAIAESGRVLAVRGQVLPATLHDVKLVADVRLPVLDREVRIQGESNIPEAAGQVRRVWLEPNNPLAYPPAIQAILAADLIVIGPGSLFTSILPNLLVPDLAAALRISRGYKFYICNVATQPGETDGFNCADHVHTIEQHIDGRLFDLVICNNRQMGGVPEELNLVLPTPNMDEEYAVYCSDLIDEDQPWRHDSKKLAQAVMDLYYERTGPVLTREDDLLQ